MHEKIEDLVKENRLNPNEHNDFRQLNMFQGGESLLYRRCILIADKK